MSTQYWKSHNQGGLSGLYTQSPQSVIAWENRAGIRTRVFRTKTSCFGTLFWHTQMLLFSLFNKEFRTKIEVNFDQSTILVCILNQLDIQRRQHISHQAYGLFQMLQSCATERKKLNIEAWRKQKKLKISIWFLCEKKRKCYFSHY